MALPRHHRLGGRSVFDYIYGASQGPGKRLYGKHQVLRVTAPDVLRLRSTLQPQLAPRLRLAPEPTVEMRQLLAATELRFAVVISKKINKRAAVRNRLRRLLHRSFLEEAPRLRCGHWLVLSLKPTVAHCSDEQLLQEWRLLLQRSGMRS